MAPSRILRLIAVAAVAWSSRGVVEYGGIARSLHGRSRIERGAIAASEWDDALARSGRPATRSAYEAAVRDGRLAGRRSRVAQGWSWVAGEAAELPPGARIYLGVPSEILYYFGTTLWYPRRVDASLAPATIVDGDSLHRVAAPLDEVGADALRAAGYTHAVAATPGGLEMIDLASLPPARP